MDLKKKRMKPLDSLNSNDLAKSQCSNLGIKQKKVQISKPLDKTEFIGICKQKGKICPREVPANIVVELSACVDENEIMKGADVEQMLNQNKMNPQITHKMILQQNVNQLMPVCYQEKIQNNVKSTNQFTNDDDGFGNNVSAVLKLVKDPETKIVLKKDITNLLSPYMEDLPNIEEGQPNYLFH